MKINRAIVLLFVSRYGISYKKSFTSLFFAIILLSVFPDPAGAQKLDLDSYKGKVVYLDFWASWCGPCRQSFPWMDRLLSLYSSGGLVVIAVNLDHDHALALNFLRDFHHQFPVVYDPDGQLGNTYHVKAMPTAVIIGRDGQIRTTHSGFFEDQENQYLAEIRAALDEKAP